MIVRNTYRVLGLVGCVLAAMAPAQAQDYPTQTITIVVPYAPGGSTDMIARIVGDELRKSLGQSVIVENKPGAYASRWSISPHRARTATRSCSAM